MCADFLYGFKAAPPDRSRRLCGAPPPLPAAVAIGSVRMSGGDKRLSPGHGCCLDWEVTIVG